MTTIKNDKTVLMLHSNYAAVDGPLTDFEGAASYEELSRRMVYAAHLAPTESFNVSLNPLVGAAGEIFSVLVTLPQQKHADSGLGLNSRMVQSIAGFEARAVRAGVDRDDVMVARYVLCTMVDETVMNQTWSEGSNGFWSTNSLLSRFHNETNGGAKFFLLLDQMSANPARYLQLLELMYLCLSLGFKGQYGTGGDTAEQLGHMRGNLLSRITALRGDPSRQISPRWQGLESAAQKGVLIVPGWMVAVFTLVILLVFFGGISGVLDEQRLTVLHVFEQADSSAHDPQS
jgi:type VI secretion system protein ImpK